MRIVSLVPSVTETLLAWGITPVGCTRFCEQPGLPQVGGTKNPDIPAVVALVPDLVVLDDEENRREDHDLLVDAGLTVHVTHVRAVADVASTLAALAAAVAKRRLCAWNNPDGGPTYRVEADRPARDPAGRRVFVAIWRRPWMTMSGDTYGSSVLAELGFVNVFADDAVRYPTVTLEEVAARQPDLVLLPTEPYPFEERHLDELEAVAADVRLVDGQDLFWWGVRTRDALERLAQSLRAENPT